MGLPELRRNHVVSVGEGKKLAGSGTKYPSPAVPTVSRTLEGPEGTRLHPPKGNRKLSFARAPSVVKPGAPAVATEKLDRFGRVSGRCPTFPAGYGSGPAGKTPLRASRCILPAQVGVNPDNHPQLNVGIA